MTLLAVEALSIRYLESDGFAASRDMLLNSLISLLSRV